MTDFTMFDYKVTDGVAVVTFNRPDKMNTFTPVVMREMIELFDVTDADDAVRAVVVTGSGRAFCAGAELGIAGADTFNFNKRAAGDEIITNGFRRDGGGRVTLRMYRSLKPVIGAVNGAAVGVGATMLLPMDFRLASTAAKFGFVFARRGITPEACSSWFLPRLVGMSKALEWCYTGRRVTAQQALAAGLVSEVLAPEDLLPRARALALEIAENSAPVSVSLIRQMFWRAQGLDHPLKAHKVESWGAWHRSRSADSAEGVRSFFEKRPPDFPMHVPSDLPDFYPWWDEPDLWKARD
jgi:enoyl-CoA hydratase/carnithine racemase